MVWLVDNKHPIEESHFVSRDSVPAAACAQWKFESDMRIADRRLADRIIQVHTHAPWVEPWISSTRYKNTGELWPTINFCS